MNLAQPLNYWLDYLLPRLGPGGSNIHTHLGESELVNYKPFSRLVQAHGGEVEVLVAAPYEDALIQNLLHRAKFYGEVIILEDLVRLLASKYADYLGELSSLAIAHTPSDPRRWRERGYHVPKLLAAKLSRLLGCQHIDLFQKTKHTKSQTELGKEDRLVALGGVFVVDQVCAYPVDNLLIVDDIITTGATFAESVRAVREKMPKTRVLGLAVAG